MTVRTQTRTPGTVVSDDAVGTVAWADPENAEASDNTYAVATNSSGSAAVTEYIKGTNFGFTVPGVADILGCKAGVERKSGGGVSFVAKADSTSTANGGSLTISKPTGTSEGDVMIAVLSYFEIDVNSISAPSGWTLRASRNINDFEGFRDHRFRVYTKQAGPSEGSSYTWTFSNSIPHAATLASYRNVDHGGIAVGTVGGTSSTGHSTTGVTRDEANNRVLFTMGLIRQSNANSVTPPSGFTERAEAHNGDIAVIAMTAYLADREFADAGSDDASAVSSTAGESSQVQVTLPPNVVMDERISLVLTDGSVGETDKASATEWPATDTVAEYGADDDTWDEELGPTDVNDEDFGLVVAANVDNGGSASVDAISLLVTYDVALEITVDTPAEDGSVVQPNFTAEATFELDGSPVTMNDTRWRIYADAAMTQLVYDSGTIASSAASHVIGSGSPSVPWASPQQGTTYYLRVTGTEDGTADPDGVGDPISGDSGLVSFITDWTLPTAPTGLAAVAVTEEV